MIVIERILGNLKREPEWRTKLADATLDFVALDQWEAQKSRCRKQSQQGLDLGISLDRNTILKDGDVLLWDEAQRSAVVVQISLRDVMVIDLNELKTLPIDESIKLGFDLGHALGNQHWKAVVKNNQVYIPLTVATKMMDSVMRTHGFQHLPYTFVQGESILESLTNGEARLLFGGAEDSDTHVHVASPLDKPEAIMPHKIVGIISGSK